MDIDVGASQLGALVPGSVFRFQNGRAYFMVVDSAVGHAFVNLMTGVLITGASERTTVEQVSGRFVVGCRADERTI